MKTITLSYVINDDELSLAVPARWEICDRCRGEGKHDPEAFSNGFSREDFDEDPDFEEDYFAGRYDVACECCHGAGKVLVPDEPAIVLNPELAAQYVIARETIEEAQREEAEYRACRRAERAMGA